MSLLYANLNFIQFSSIKYDYSSQRSKCVSRFVRNVMKNHNSHCRVQFDTCETCSRRQSRVVRAAKRAIPRANALLFGGERVPERIQVSRELRASPYTSCPFVPHDERRQRGGWFLRSSGPETNYPPPWKLSRKYWKVRLRSAIEWLPFVSGATIRAMIFN